MMDCLTPFPVRGGQIAESTGMSESYAIRGHVGADFFSRHIQVRRVLCLGVNRSV